MIFFSKLFAKVQKKSYLCKWKRKNMRKRSIFFIFWAFILVGLTACHSPQHDARVMQRLLSSQIQTAQSQADSVLALLNAGTSIDEVRTLLEQEPQILCYVFDHHKLVYWSSNWLAVDDIHASDTISGWWYQLYNNAHAVSHWTRAGDYEILTVIPLKYSYPFENRQLHNTFVPPFSGDEHYQITELNISGFYPVYGPDSLFLFSLSSNQPFENQEVVGPLADSFSYRQLMDPNAERPAWYNRPRILVRFYWGFLMSLLGLLVLLGIWGVIRHRGFRNMKLRTRIVYVVVAMLMAAFVYVFVTSTRYVRSHYQQRQQNELKQKTLLIQSHLHDLYFATTPSRPMDGSSLSADLLKMSYIYASDIHLYDLRGNLLATSAPELFQKGLVSTLMSPEPFFSSDSLGLYYEQIGEMRYLAGYIPFIGPEATPVGYISVPLFISEIEMHREINAFLSRLLPPCILLLFLTLAVSFFLARGLTRPLNQLSQKMSHFRLGNNSNHIDYPYQDELGELVRNYNEMVDQVERASAQLAKSEREGAWRTMARQIAHEINNLLTPIKLNIQQLQRMRGTERFDAYFDRTAASLVTAIDNLSHMASSFSTFAKMPEVVVEPTDIAQRLSAVITLFRSNTEQVPIRYVGADAGVMAMADPEQVAQVFTNILRNAIQAGASDIIVILNQNYSPTHVEVSVSDDGCGISPEDQAKIFAPNFTTKSTGTGLGLAISKNIVEASGGSIRFESSPKGTIFYIYFKKP